MSIKSSDRRRASTNNSTIGNRQFAGNEQTMLVRDIISEGPIEGLVAGGSSIYLNNDSMMSQAETPFISSGGMSYASGTAGQNTLQINTAGLIELKNLDADFIMIKYLLNLTGTVTLVSTVDVAPVEARGSYTVLKYTYRFTVGSGGTLTTQMSSTGVIGAGNTNQLPTTAVKDRVGFATFADGWSYSMLNVSANSFDFETNRAWLAGSNVNVKISQFYKIASVTSSAITLESPLQYTFVKKDYSVPGKSRVQGAATTAVTKKYDASSFQLSTGTLAQAPHKSFFGTGTASVQLSGPNIGGNLDAAVPQYIQGSTSASGAQLASMDKVILTFQYPGGLYRVNKDQGNEYPEFVAYRIELAVQRTSNAAELENYVKLPGTYSYQAKEPQNQTYRATGISTGEVIFLHKAQTKDAYIITNTIDLEPYKPFRDFKLKITRLTKSGQDDTSESMYHKTDWKAHPNSQAVHTAKISSAVGLITEKLNYPFTAHATVTFSSKNFSSMPTRGYECYGLKVKVPNVYITREELKENQAKYTRNPITGEDTGTVQFWDGGFREKVYTDNPAWVFYDILTNNRYGLGDWMRTQVDGQGNKTFPDIDIYSLYKISKYCDELVPDGKGGLEPRFRANFYFTKATDCYKVLKDMATTFNSILYWSDGKLMPVMDTKKEPVYNFTKGNVVEGRFDYQTTGSKTRANQIIVSWNNPENGYKLEPLIVEDRENILKTGKILKEEATAFGATSYGQALRFGRWKLWTAVNQTEIVSFSTAINAAFLAPGDVINVQDSSDFSIDFSGRVATATTTQITLDRQIAVTPNAQNTYELTVLFSGQHAILNQDSATINGVVYFRGEKVPGITSVELAENTVDSVTGEHVDIQFGEGTYVETSLIQSAGLVNGKTVLTCAAFNQAPSAGTIWAIKHTNLGDTVASSYKAYKIMSIAEENKNTYSIVAVEHYDEKFDAVEGDFSLEVDDPLYPDESDRLDVPAIEDLRISKRPKSNTSGEDILIQWTAPSAIYGTTNSTTYEHLASYELEYYDADERYVVQLSPSTTSYVLDLMSVEDEVVVGVTAISIKGRRSEQVLRVFDLTAAYNGDATRFYGLRAGGFSNTNFTLDTVTGEVGFNQQPTLASSYSTHEAKTMLLSNTQQTSGLAVGEKGYLLADYSALETADAFRLVQYVPTDAALRVAYWKDLDLAPWATQTGSVSVVKNTTKVVGVGTSFTTAFPAEGQKVIKLSNTQAAYVTSVESDTILYIDRTFATDITSVVYSKPSLVLDYEQDFLFGSITKVSTNLYRKVSYLTIDTDLEAANIYSVKPIYANAADPTSIDPVFSASFSPGGNTHVYFYRYVGLEPAQVVWGSQDDPVDTPFVRVDDNWEFTKIVGNSVTVGTVGTDVDGNTTVELIDENGSTTITVSKGPTGYNSATVFLYKSGATAPAKPTGDLTYTFNTGAVTGAGLDDWSTAPSTPPSGQSLWEIQATAFSNTESDTIPASEFTNPVAVSISGLSGRSSAVVTLYQKSTSGTTAPDDPTGTFTYTFSTKTFAADVGADLKGWTVSRQSLSEGDYLWAIQGSVVSVEGGDTDSIAASEFSDAAVVGSNIKGDPGTNYTTVVLYKTGAEAPPKPTGSFTYSFSANTLTAIDTADIKGWSLNATNAPAGEYLWAIQATAFATASTDIIADTEWSAQFVVTSSGADGFSKGDIVLYQKNTSSTTAPSDPTGDFTYTFSSGAFTANTEASFNSWSQTMPTLSVGDYLWAIRASAVGTSTTVVISASQFGDAVVVGANIKGDTPVKGVDYDDGLTGFMYYYSGTASVASSYITAENPEVGQIAIVESSTGVQAAYRYEATGWVSKKIVNTEIIFADAIKAEQLHISNSTGTTSGIFMDGTNNCIKIYDGTNLRVKLGKLTA